MIRSLTRLAVALGLAATALTAAAHHSFAIFDHTQTVTLQGKVLSFQWTNPHGYLELDVRDDGPGLGNGATRPGPVGIGLTNARARLERLYGADYELWVGDAAGGGLEARVRLPFRRVPVEWVRER